MDKRYLDASLSPAERTEILLAQMTLEEKVGQLMQISCMKADPKFEEGKAVGWLYGRMSDTERNEWVSEKYAGSFLHVLGDEITIIQAQALNTRLGIPVLFGIDAIHGHALHNGATIFPSQLAMACSWDVELIEAMGRVTAKEVSADGIHWTFSPVLCIARDTRWGRVGETFGEDPYLIGALGSAIIKGYQTDQLGSDDSILACAKHYLAYGESTGGRDAYDSEVSLRKIRNVFLPPFIKAVEAGCATFMTGYQSISGVPVTIHKPLLSDILKKEIGFDGFVVTDWNNTESLVTQQRVCATLEEAAKQTLEAGNDMIMNTPGAYEAYLSLCQNNDLSVAVLDEAVRRILLVKFKFGLFEKARVHKLNPQNIWACEAHQAVNLALTRKTMVLLENKHECLPIRSSIKKIAVIGPNADDIEAQYGDWTYFSHPYPKVEVPKEPHYTMRSGIEKVASAHKVSVSYHKGCDAIRREAQDIAGAVAVAREADLIVAVVGDTLLQNGEFKDRGNLDLSGGQQDLLEALKRTGKPLVVILVSGKPLSVPWIKAHADALLVAFNPGMFGGLVAGEILFGETNPSGKLSISMPAHVGQLPVYYNQLPGWHGSQYIDLPMAPLYSFGYGLSYAQVSYSQLKLSSSTCKAGETVAVGVTVTNHSAIATEEVVQLYINRPTSAIMMPFKELKGFKRQHIPPRTSVEVVIFLRLSELSIMDENGHPIPLKGEVNIMVGPSSLDQTLLSSKISVL